MKPIGPNAKTISTQRHPIWLPLFLEASFQSQNNPSIETSQISIKKTNAKDPNHAPSLRAIILHAIDKSIPCFTVK